ncbi:MAG: TIM barrel protein, partial [Microbacterium sp.]|nr:TIM barrel protein [Microbacterium sp.]
CWYDLHAVPQDIDLLVIDGPPWALNPFIRGRAEQLFDRVVPGGIVLLEPVSGMETYPLKTAADALAIIARVKDEHGVDNVKLLADFYHLAVNGDDVPAVIAGHAAEFGHIQIADAPGRGEPGTGDLPLAQWIADAQAGGYSGYIGLEYKATQAEPFAWLND